MVQLANAGKRFEVSVAQHTLVRPRLLAKNRNAVPYNMVPLWNCVAVLVWPLQIASLRSATPGC